MDISLNPTRVNSPSETPINLSSVGKIAKSNNPAPLLSGNALSITSNSSDYDKLLALLLSQTNEARKKSAANQFSSLSSLFSALIGSINTYQQMAQKALDAATEALGHAEKASAQAAKNVTDISNEITDYTTQLNELLPDYNQKKAVYEAAKTAYEGITKLPDETDTEFEARKALAKNDLDAAENHFNLVSAEKTHLENQITDANTRLEQANRTRSIALNTEKLKNDELIKAINDLDSVSYGVLMDALRLSATEIDDVNTLENKSEEDEKRKAGILPYAERSPIEIIRDALRRADGDLLNTLESRREVTI